MLFVVVAAVAVVVVVAVVGGGGVCFICLFALFCRVDVFCSFFCFFFSLILH